MRGQLILDGLDNLARFCEMQRGLLRRQTDRRVAPVDRGGLRLVWVWPDPGGPEYRAGLWSAGSIVAHAVTDRRIPAAATGAQAP
jgi:hypothetical protein